MLPRAQPAVTAELQAWLTRARRRHAAQRIAAAVPGAALMSGIGVVALGAARVRSAPLDFETAAQLAALGLGGTVVASIALGLWRASRRPTAALADEALGTGALITTASELSRQAPPTPLAELCVRDARRALERRAVADAFPVAPRLSLSVGLAISLLACAILLLLVLRVAIGFVPLLPGKSEVAQAAPQGKPQAPQARPESAPTESPTQTPKEPPPASAPAGAAPAETPAPAPASAPAPQPQPQPQNEENAGGPEPPPPPPIQPRVDTKLVPIEAANGARRNRESTILEIVEGMAPSTPVPTAPTRAPRAVEVAPAELPRLRRAAEKALLLEKLTDPERRFAQRYWEGLAP